MSRPAWQFDEFAFAGEEHLDARFVEAYDVKAQFDPGDDVQALKEMGLTRDDVVVDLGAGTGTFALAIAPHCRRVVAVDVSPAMLDAIRKRALESGASNVEAVHAGFLSYQYEGEPADFVYTRNALHHLPDFWKVIALTRVAGFMRDGGGLLLHDLVYSFPPGETAETFERWFSNAVSRPEQGYTGDELRTHVRTEFSTFAWLLEPMLERAGFDIVDATHRPAGTYSAYRCVKRA